MSARTRPRGECSLRALDRRTSRSGSKALITSSGNANRPYLRETVPANRRICTSSMTPRTRSSFPNTFFGKVTTVSRSAKWVSPRCFKAANEMRLPDEASSARAPSRMTTGATWMLPRPRWAASQDWLTTATPNGVACQAGSPFSSTIQSPRRENTSPWRHSRQSKGDTMSPRFPPKGPSRRREFPRRRGLELWQGAQASRLIHLGFSNVLDFLFGSKRRTDNLALTLTL